MCSQTTTIIKKPTTYPTPFRTGTKVSLDNGSDRNKDSAGLGVFDPVTYRIQPGYEVIDLNGNVLYSTIRTSSGLTILNNHGRSIISIVQRSQNPVYTVVDHCHGDRHAATVTKSTSLFSSTPSLCTRVESYLAKGPDVVYARGDPVGHEYSFKHRGARVARVTRCCPANAAVAGGRAGSYTLEVTSARIAPHVLLWACLAMDEALRETAATS